MSKVSRVTVLCPNGRREIINLLPNSSILQILEQACQKQSLNPDDFDVCHYNKALDLTLPVRFANLSNNAQLELQPAKYVRKDSLVTIGLQLESGRRILKDFVPSSSLWDVVEKCLNTQSEENLGKNGEPVCIYMRQKLIGDELKTTTLRNLGLTKGSAVIRLIYRNQEDLLDQAHMSIPLINSQESQMSPSISEDKSCNKNVMEYDPLAVNKELSSVLTCNPQINEKPPYSENQNISNEFVSPVSKFSNIVKNDKQNIENVNIKNDMIDVKSYGKICHVDENAAVKSLFPVIKEEIKDQAIELVSNNTMGEETGEEDIGTIHYIGERHAVIYSLDDITEVKKADLPDEFYELTIDDVRYLMQEYAKTRLELENKPLLTKEFRDKQMLKNLGQYRQTVLRVYFPERLVLQAVFEAEETVQDVCKFIANYLEDQSLNFYLYTTPPKEKKDPEKSLIEAMLIPAAVVYFGSDSHHSSYLLSSLREKISDPRAASLAAYESRKQAMSAEHEEIIDEAIPISSMNTDLDDYKAPGPSFDKASSFVQSSEKVPKWLKLNRK